VGQFVRPASAGEIDPQAHIGQSHQQWRRELTLHWGCRLRYSAEDHARCHGVHEQAGLGGRAKQRLGTLGKANAQVQ